MTAEDLLNVPLVVDDQPVFLELAVLPVVETDLVWQVLADLHDTALGGEPTGYGLDLTPEEAFEAWSRGTLGLDGYLRAVSPETAAGVLSSATDFADFSGSLAGIDSVYLTAFSSAGRDLAASGPTLDYASAVLAELGMPQTAGGGAAQTFVHDAANGRAALVDHDSLRAKLDAVPAGNIGQLLDVLAREGIGAGASAARSVIPGSGTYVREAGGAVVATSEGAAWGAAVGSIVPGIGSAAGAIVGAVVGFFSWLGGSHGDAVAKGEQVPVSPPAPVTDREGHTTRVGTDGSTTPGRAVADMASTHPPHPPGPKATELHCPRPDDDAPPEFRVPGWGTEYSLMPALAPHGPGMDALIGSVGASVLLPPAAQVSWEGEIAAAGLWVELLGEQTTRGQIGGRIIDRGLLEKVRTARVRAELAEALVIRTDPSATLQEAIVSLQEYGRGTGIGDQP